MTDSDHFENEILQDAEQKANKVLLKAKQEAEKILEQAHQEKNALIQKKYDEIEKEEEQKIQRELSKLRITNKIELNNVKQQLLNRIFTKSLERIQEWREKKSERYRSALEHQIIQGGISLEGGELTVKLAPEDVSLIEKEKLESKITHECGTKTSIKIISSEDDSVDGGSIISKGHLTVSNTIEARLERQEEPLRDKVHRMLFIS